MLRVAGGDVEGSAEGGLYKTTFLEWGVRTQIIGGFFSIFPIILKNLIQKCYWRRKILENTN